MKYALFGNSAVVQGRPGTSRPAIFSPGLETFVLVARMQFIESAAPSSRIWKHAPYHPPNSFTCRMRGYSAICTARARYRSSHRTGVAACPPSVILDTFSVGGNPVAVRAASELYHSGTKFKLLIVGDGAAASEVRKTIAALEAQEYASFLGRIPHNQVDRYFRIYHSRMPLRHFPKQFSHRQSSSKWLRCGVNDFDVRTLDEDKPRLHYR